MSDADLEEIRKGRLAQLQQQQQGGAAGDSGQVEQRKYVDPPVRNLCVFLSHGDIDSKKILQPEAADRLGRIRLVKESRAIDVENRLIMLARSGQLRAKVTEEQLKELLGAVAENNERDGTSAGKIVVSRRKGGWDEDDDLLLDL
ncbi:MAG: hypothetical protein Q9211_000049 [Gyalolechia sp. 1 TL-2023]